ncbi:hypothetical protein AB0E85_02180 [Streptomyces sp. NPDC029044]|uniref:hypothetical protein n=1 Tax=Streptomyces sp. NPDC029044 TaxID=3157198 RepID=UPI0033E99679
MHPLLVQVPIGSRLSAAVLDLRPGRSRESGLLIGVGLGAAAPAAVAGWVDRAARGGSPARAVSVPMAIRVARGQSSRPAVRIEAAHSLMQHPLVKAILG